MAQKPTSSKPASSPSDPAQGATIGYSPVTLPSRGVLYPAGVLPGGVIQMRKMRSGDMARMQSQGGSSISRIEAVVNSCTVFPDGLSSKDLLLGDSFFLMLALRTMSFGPTYSYTWRCRYCGSVEKAKVDIVEDLDEKAAKEGLEEPFEVVLPDADCIVGCRLLRVRDQDSIVKHAKRAKLQSSDLGDPSFSYRLALCIVTKDGAPFDSILDRQDFIKSLSAADTIRLDRSIGEMEPAVDLSVYPSCSACGADNEISLPFDADFFRPSDL